MSDRRFFIKQSLAYATNAKEGDELVADTNIGASVIFQKKNGAWFPVRIANSFTGFPDEHMAKIRAFPMG